MAKAKTEKKATPHWVKMVETYFLFCEKKFSEKPSFDGSGPRDLKGIVEALQKRADDAGVEWTEENAINRLQNFLEAGYNIPWLRENFLLFNLNRQKDKIFFSIKKQSNGTARIGGFGEKPNPTTNAQGTFGKL